ncbi:hypothetical protein MNB_SV-14-1151 [hydrothermal vent metagenome]|uniref:CHAT domain-containing protein n=1 Tax=hydrothermal vent metagenome TaxID=652676 RepID=A0A1W1CGK9_9ZZZZ
MMNYYNKALEYESKKIYPKAIENYKDSLKLALKNLDKNHMYIGVIYNSLGMVHTETKDYELAIEEYNRALTIFKQLFGKDDAQIAIIYNNLAVVYGKKQNYKEAIHLYEESIKIEEESLSEDIIDTYYNLGLLYQKIREYSKALTYYQKALPFIQNKPTLMATYYGLIGSYYQEVEDNAKALSYYQKALKIREEVFGEESIESSESYNNLGSIYEALRDYSQALIYYKKALKINKKILDKNDLDIATIYNNIASVYNSLEEYNKAKKYILKTLEMKNSVLKPNDIDFAVTYTNVGFIYENLKNYKNASIYYNKALSIYQNVLGEESLEVAITYNNIASLHKSKKEYAISLKYLEKSKNIMDKILTKYDTRRALIYNNLGLLYEYTKNYSNAYYSNNLSFQIFLKNRNKNFQTLDSKQKEKYLKSFGNRIDNLLYSAILYTKEQNSSKETSLTQQNIFNHWLNYKGSIFEYQNILAMIEEKSKDKNTTKNIQNLRALTLQLAKLENIYINKREANYNEKREELEEKIHNIQITLSKETPQFKELLGLNNIDTKLIANTLKPYQLYIDFVRGEKSYYIFTLDYTNHITFQQIDDEDTKDIEANIQAFRANNHKISDAIDREKLTKKLNKKLKDESKQILSIIYKKLFKNHLLEQIKDKESLIISPDGVLNFLPFEALYSKDKYLIEKYTINYISSGRELIRQSRREKQKSSEKIVVFGSPDFWLKLPENNSSSLTKNIISQKNATIFDISFKTLDISKQEIETMKRYYPKLEIYQEKNATVKNLFKIKSPKILHISTHGFFLDNKNNPNPMLATGLAFAGANYANYKNDARGIATALKLSSLKLQHTELVILSACETGLGKIHQAEGVTGLSKAFIQAGAKHVIMSLWSVSSRETVTLMQHFYENIHKKDNYATALHKAKLQMINMHPYYWSAFIMSGI